MSAALLGLMPAGSVYAAPAMVAGTRALPDGKQEASAALAVTPGAWTAA